MSSDSPQYIHGFQGDMDTDDVHAAIKLWIPQLSENAVESLNRIHRAVRPHECCLFCRCRRWIRVVVISYCASSRRRF